MRISDVQVYRYALPLKTPVYLKHRPMRERRGYLLRLMNESGAYGWGEAAPLPGFSNESYNAATEELIRCAEKLLGYRLPDTYSDLEGAGLVNIQNVNSVSFAIESAYYNMMAMQCRLPLHHYLNPFAADTIMINALLSGTDDEVLAKAARLNPKTTKAAKLKVGIGEVEGEIKRICDVRKALDDSIALRLDANRAWNLNDALEVAESVQGCAIEYIEEPLFQPFKLPEFSEKCSIPYALDETLQGFYKLLIVPIEGKSESEIRTSVHNLTVLFEGAYACVWKPSIMHVPHMGEDIHSGNFAFPIQRLVLSAAYESGVGIANLAAYAAAFSKPEIPAGLDTYSWLAEDVLQSPLPIQEGSLDLAAAHAASQQVDLDKLEVVWAGSA